MFVSAISYPFSFQILFIYKFSVGKSCQRFVTFTKCLQRIILVLLIFSDMHLFSISLISGLYYFLSLAFFGFNLLLLFL